MHFSRDVSFAMEKSTVYSMKRKSEQCSLSMEHRTWLIPTKRWKFLDVTGVDRVIGGMIDLLVLRQECLLRLRSYFDCVSEVESG